MPRRDPTTPDIHRYMSGLGSSPFARHYWGNHCYFLFLQVLRCFSSLRLPPYLNMDNYPSSNWVVPFGNPGIRGHLHLPRAYRSLSRPSSPPRAKASTRRPNLLSPIGRHLPTLHWQPTALLILSAVIEITLSFLIQSLYLQLLVCQYVKDRCHRTIVRP